MEKEIKDVCIIGGGPIGIYSAFYCAVHGLKVTLIESLDYLGGQLTTIYQDKYIYDIPGFKAIKAKDYILNLKEQMDTKSDFIELMLNTTANSLEKKVYGYDLITNNGVISAKTILIASGDGAYEPRKIGVDLEDTFDNIYYSMSDFSIVKNKNVIVLGGGDSAVDFALQLQKIAKSVVLIHRRNEFRAHEGELNQLINSSVNVMTPYVVKGMSGKEKTLDRVRICHVENDLCIEVHTDLVLVCYGAVSKKGLFESWDLEMGASGISVNELYETNLSGIYAVGNACSYKGKIRLITAGNGEAMAAITNIKRYCRESTRK